MKKLKLLFSICALSIILFQSIIFSKNVQAVSIGDTKYLERANKGFYSIQRWNGSEWIYVTYSITYYNDEQGNKKIAYCIDPNLKGIGWISGEQSGYDVQIDSLLSDERLWRVYINGYPYKSPTDLGVETEEDAYLATKMASYAILRSNSVDDIRNLYRAGQDKVEGEKLEDIQRRGTKVIDAICNLVDKGYNGKENLQYNDLLSVCESSDFSEDNINKSYYSKTFMVTSKFECRDYKVTSIDGFPEGSYICNLSGNLQEEFSGREEFKLMIPKESIKDDINGKIHISGVCKNYPIYYGKCKIGNYQNYMLCCDMYSDNINASTDVFIKSRNSKIQIVKIDKDTKLPISGVQFLAKYEDGTEIGVFETNENGMITIDNIIQGNIILKEIKAPEKYVINNKDFNIKVEYNECKKVVIENEQKKGSIRIVKVDANDENIKIAGVKFGIYNDNNECINQVVTDENGEAQINDLSVGYKYIVKELETVDGYIRSDEIVTITLNEGECKTLTFKNKKKEAEKIEKLPRTGELDISNYLLGTCFMGFTVIFKSNRFARKEK